MRKTLLRACLGSAAILLVFAATAGALRIQAGDIVVVPETKSPNWNNISSILSAVLNASYLTRLGLF